MNIFSLSRLVDLSERLPVPTGRAALRRGLTEVVRITIPEWNPVRDAAHPEWECELLNARYAEFELTLVRDAHGAIAPRWVLRGLVAF